VILEIVPSNRRFGHHSALPNESGLPAHRPISFRTTRWPRRTGYRCRGTLLLFLLVFRPAGFAEHSDSVTEWATSVGFGSQLYQNIVYQKANSVDLRLDVITTRSDSDRRPVVIFFHGGGWVQGKKENHLLKLLPYLARGMDGVNVEYRLANEAEAPGAVEDCRCALQWVFQHAKDYGFDSTKIVVTGESAGGHLALMTGMLTYVDGFDYSCELPPEQWSGRGGPRQVRVAAIVNFFGVTDVTGFLEPQNPANFVVRWLGDPNRVGLAKRLSPLAYVRKDSPPIITVQGDKDPYVPYEQAVRLHQALDRAGIQNQLVTVHGGHGPYSVLPWTTQQNWDAYQDVFRFLEKVGVLEK
jgi:acetyl esterase/lipase